MWVALAVGRGSGLRARGRSPGWRGLVDWGMRVLLVEDDAELAGILGSGLREHGMECVRASTHAEGRARATAARFDVIVLDVMLPGGSGFDLCRELRRTGDATPILMLT